MLLASLAILCVTILPFAAGNVVAEASEAGKPVSKPASKPSFKPTAKPKAVSPIKPKVLIINMFIYEQAVFVHTPTSESFGFFNYYHLGETIKVPGLSSLFPYVYCNAEKTICEMTTGEAEINAAASSFVRSQIQVLKLKC